MLKKTKKQKIIKTAAKLFSKFGFRGVSMNTIAAEISITKPALYYHFKNKEDLYFEAANSSFKSLIGELKSVVKDKSKTPREKLLAMSKKYFEIGLQDESFTKIMARGSFEKKDGSISSRLVKLRKKTNKIFEKIFLELYKERSFFKKKNPKNDASLLMGTIDGLTINAEFLNKAEKEKVEKQIKRVASLILKVDK